MGGARADAPHAPGARVYHEVPSQHPAREDEMRALDFRLVLIGTLILVSCRRMQESSLSPKVRRDSLLKHANCATIFTN